MTVSPVWDDNFIWLQFAFSWTLLIEDAQLAFVGLLSFTCIDLSYSLCLSLTWIVFIFLCSRHSLSMLHNSPICYFWFQNSLHLWHTFSLCFFISFDIEILYLPQFIYQSLALQFCVPFSKEILYTILLLMFSILCSKNWSILFIVENF